LGSLVQRTERQCTTAELAQIEYAYVDSNGNVSAVTKDANGTFVDANGNALTGVTEDDPNMIMYIMDNKFNDSDLDVCTVTKDANGDYIREEYNLTNTDDEYLSTLSESQLAQLMEEEEEYLALCQQKYGTDDYLVRYIKNTSTGEYNPYFYKKSDLTGANYDSNGNSLSNINCYTIGSETKSEEVKSLKGCQIEKDSSGRYINVTIPIYNSDGTIDTSSSGTTYALTTSTATDQDAYEDAMNQYEYEKYEYDQSIQEINAKIEIIQAEDKNLELRLKQLDTEQKAISTEIDAVSQVIQKNTESSFKTFG
jgi:hypothetical protein